MTLNGERERAGLPELPPFGGSRAAGPLYSTTQRFVLHDEAQRTVRPALAARLLDVDEDTIYRLIHDGELASFHIGRARLVTVASIDALIARRLEEETR